MDVQELINHPAPSAGRINRAIFGTGNMSAIPKHVLEEATKRGSWVHESIEHIINNEDYVDNWEWEGYIEAFNNFNKEYQPEYLASEVPIVDSDNLAKGIVDAFCYIDNELHIIDFKTSASTISHSWKMQLMIYKWICDNNDIGYEPTKLKVIKLGKDGTFKVLYYDYSEQDTKAAIDIYQYMLKEGAIKGKC